MPIKNSSIPFSRTYFLNTIFFHFLQRTQQHVLMANTHINKRVKGVLPSRSEQIDRLKNQQFDVLVIGGGATGSGVRMSFSIIHTFICKPPFFPIFQCALDAQTRGLTTAMVELDDFSSGTSSRSTKLIHGGVRYLQKVPSTVCRQD